MGLLSGPLRFLFLLFALAFLFQQSNAFPLETEDDEIDGSKIYARKAIVAAAQGTPRTPPVVSKLPSPTPAVGGKPTSGVSPNRPQTSRLSTVLEDPINPKSQYCKAKKPKKSAPKPKKAPPAPASSKPKSGTKGSNSSPSKSAPVQNLPAPQGKTTAPRAKGAVRQRDVLDILGEFNVTSSDSNTHQLQRRVDFSQADTPAANLARIHAILADPTTRRIIGDESFSNSFILDTDEDIQMGTVGVGLQGCAIIVSHNQNRIYVAHAWEVPGFSAAPPDFPSSTFPTDVEAFFAGTDGAVGDGSPLVGTMVAGSTTHILAVANDKPANGFGKTPHYPGKVKNLVNLFQGKVGPTNVFLYRRPIAGNNDPVVAVTIEYSATLGWLRVMVADRRSGADGGYRMIDQQI